MKKNGARKRGNEKHRASVLTFRSEAKKDEKKLFHLHHQLPAFCSQRCNPFRTVYKFRIDR